MEVDPFDMKHIEPLSTIQAEWLTPFFVEIYSAENCADDEVLFKRSYDIRLPSTQFTGGDYEISLTQVNGTKVCGKRGAMNLMNTVMADSQTKTCPYPDFIPCAPEMSVHNSICRAPDESPDQCPITSISFVPIDSEAL